MCWSGFRRQTTQDQHISHPRFYQPFSQPCVPSQLSLLRRVSSAPNCYSCTKSETRHSGHLQPRYEGKLRPVLSMQGASTDHVIPDMLLNGLSDHNIHKDILGTKDILTKPINDVVASVETNEMARNVLPSATLQHLDVQADNTSPAHNPVPALASSDRDRVSTCLDYKASFKMFTESTQGWNTKPHKVCINCYRAQNRRNQRQHHSPQAPKANLQAVESDPISQIPAFQATETLSDNGDRDGFPPIHGSFSRTLSHHIFTKGEWRQARLRDHPWVPVTIELDSRRQ